MHNIQATPSAACPRLASLDPINTSGTTGITSSYAPHPRKPKPKQILTLSPPSSPPSSSPPSSSPPSSSSNPSSSPHSSSTPSPGQPPLSPAQKLDNLLSTISSVLTAYARLPHQSGLYLRVLRGFYERGMILAGQRVGGRERYFDEDDRDGVRGGGAGFGIGGNLGDGPRGNGGGGGEGMGNGGVFVIDGGKVDELERDWWGSEVVVAWYGPRPGVRAGTGVVRERRNIKGREQVVKEREEVMGSKMPTGVVLGKALSWGTEREVHLKRDASFLGLGDD